MPSGGEVERVGSGGEGFIELAVAAQAFDSGGKPADGSAESTAGDRVVFIAVCRLMIRCGLLVCGQRVRRWSSQPRMIWWVRSSRVGSGTRGAQPGEQGHDGEAGRAGSQKAGG